MNDNVEKCMQGYNNRPTTTTAIWQYFISQVVEAKKILLNSV